MALCVREAPPTENRGIFKVIEFWLENRLMLEFLLPELATQYLRAIQPQIAEQMFGAPILEGSSLEE